MTLPGPFLRLGNRRIPAFRVCGLIGLALGVAIALMLAPRANVSTMSVLAVTALGLLACVAAIAIRIAITGTGKLVWSENEAAVIATTLAFGAFLGDPRPLLDVVAPGLVVMLACGRIGCLLAGCCHGRPAQRGLLVSYGPQHAAAGFAPSLVGVPLIAVQLMESVWAAAVAAGGVILVFSDAPAGIAAVFVLGARITGRMAMQRLRGHCC